MGDRRFGPQRAADLQCLVDAGSAGVEVQPDGVPLLAQPARADPEVEPAARDDVEGGGRAGADERVPQPDVVDLGAEPDVLVWPARNDR